MDYQDFEIESYDEELVRKIIEKIVIYEENLKLVFKSSLDTEIENRQSKK